MPKNVNILFHPTVISPGIPTALCKIGGRNRDREAYNAKKINASLALFLEHPSPGGALSRH